MILATQLGPRLAGRVRAMLDAAFDGDFTDEDWAHCLGGTHAVVVEAGEPIAHAAVVPRTLWHDDQALRCGYVEAVAVRADHRGQGLGATMMDALEEVIRAHFELGALSTTEAGRGFYLARGWLPWRGLTSVRAAAGTILTPDDDGGVFVLPVRAALDLDAELTCDFRPGYVW